MKPIFRALWIAAVFVMTSCTAGASVPSLPALSADSLDIAAIEHVLGMKGTEQAGEFKVVVPQNDLDVTVDGFHIIPPMGMGSWAAFSSIDGGAMVMGDIVVRENEIRPIQKVLVEHGLTMTALHNHFVRDLPKIMYMHIGGTGSEEELARGVRAALDEVAALRGGSPAEGRPDTVENTLNTQRISEIVGHPGEMNRGVYKITIGRPDVDLKDHGASVSTFMGFNTWASWQGTPEKAAVAGDFTLLEDEVEPVIEALIKNDIEVVAVHNHMVHEQPRTFFLHYWGVGRADALARGLRAALDRTGR